MEARVGVRGVGRETLLRPTVIVYINLFNDILFCISFLSLASTTPFVVPGYSQQVVKQTGLGVSRKASGFLTRASTVPRWTQPLAKATIFFVLLSIQFMLLCPMFIVVHFCPSSIGRTKLKVGKV